MPVRVRCPECAFRFNLRRDDEDRRRLRCPECDASFDNPEFDDFDDRPRKPKKKSSGTRTLVILGIVGVVSLLTCVGGPIGLWWWAASPTSFPEQTEDYADARKNFKTTLVTKGPSPQFNTMESPPRDVTVLPYTSDGLALKAWVNVPPAKGDLKPAIVYCHGGFAFGSDDWDQTQVFRNAGFVVAVPILRGENNQPGNFSLFYDETSDVIAVAEVLAKTPGVDPNRIYVCGHSAGGTLAMLAALTSKRFKAAASFAGSPDQVVFCRFNPDLPTFDTNNRKEYEMRSPLAYPKSFKCPVRLYYGADDVAYSSSTPKLAEKASAAGLDVQAVEIPGDHFDMLDPAMAKALIFFQQK